MKAHVQGEAPPHPNHDKTMIPENDSKPPQPVAEAESLVGVASTDFLAGEPLVTTDRGNLSVALDATTKIDITPAVDKLTAIGSIDGAADLILIHDASSTGQKEKKVTFDNFKAALNIPPGSSDEKVAVIAGGTAGYLWGTTGSDGLIRMGSSMSWAKDAGNGFVTLDVATIDGGTF